MGLNPLFALILFHTQFHTQKHPLVQLLYEPDDKCSSSHVRPDYF